MNRHYKTLLIGVILLATTLLTSVIASAQSAPAKIETFLSTIGIVTIRDQRDIGFLETDYEEEVHVRAIAAYELGKETVKYKALQIWTIGESGNQSAYIDLDEVAGLSRAVGQLVTVANQWKNMDKEFMEVKFATKAGFEVAFYQEERYQIACVTVQGELFFFRTMEDLAELKKLIDKGLETLGKM